jgi:hypothetical protein
MTALELLESRLTFIQDDLWESRDKVEKVLIIGRDFFNASLLCYQQLRGDAAKQAELQQAIRDAWAKYAAPYDIPGIGPGIEFIVDNQLPNFLASMVTTVDAKLDKVLPNPVPKE